MPRKRALKKMERPSAEEFKRGAVRLDGINAVARQRNESEVVELSSDGEVEMAEVEVEVHFDDEVIRGRHESVRLGGRISAAEEHVRPAKRSRPPAFTQTSRSQTRQLHHVFIPSGRSGDVQSQSTSNHQEHSAERVPYTSSQRAAHTRLPPLRNRKTNQAPKRPAKINYSDSDDKDMEDFVVDESSDDASQASYREYEPRQYKNTASQNDASSSRKNITHELDNLDIDMFGWNLGDDNSTASNPTFAPSRSTCPTPEEPAEQSTPQSGSAYVDDHFNSSYYPDSPTPNTNINYDSDLDSARDVARASIECAEERAAWYLHQAQRKRKRAT
ncbi:hypothetical protein BDV95DRAFT_668965 [Massariosphaeria phaeospora]|uniref:Uncharacterized protein n=1 Tax=Massariosphaeria phaeospora TaxID=100035 RepID=A0A7C8I4U9_9PLEO|nr:hypothetical protein BDV95DRAFT_668965 [Massariosphaeria phaeospora]